jgi:hypothetical protein
MRFAEATKRLADMSFAPTFEAFLTLPADKPIDWRVAPKGRPGCNARG